jgi:type II secretory pathway pseudopilin PulG
LTLAELVVAFGILAFAALTVIGVFLALLKTSSKNREQAMAELLTESLLERASAAGPPRWGVNGQTGTRLEAVLQQDGARFFYQVDTVLVPPVPVPAEEDGQCYQVTVTVGWWAEQDSHSLEEAREGFGNRYVKGVRTVYRRPGDRV